MRWDYALRDGTGGGEDEVVVHWDGRGSGIRD